MKSTAAMFVIEQNTLLPESTGITFLHKNDKMLAKNVIRCLADPSIFNIIFPSLFDKFDWFEKFDYIFLAWFEVHIGLFSDHLVNVLKY